MLKTPTVFKAPGSRFCCARLDAALHHNLAMAATVQSRLGIEDVLLAQRQEILAIADKHGAFNVRVFGSVARGEATAQSDVDFLVDYDSARTTPWFPASLQSELEDLLERSVDVATEGGLGRIKQRVLAEAVEL